MKVFEIKLEGKEEVIHLNKLTKDELQNMINISLRCENYEMCAHLKKFIDLLDSKKALRKSKIGKIWT